MSKSSRGYVIIAQDSGDFDYHHMAYALALSIKNTQSTVNKVCLITDRNLSALPSKYDIFDYKLSIPWGDHAEHSSWKIDNKWKYYYATPFDESVILDADMIFTGDVSSWWDIMATKDICATVAPSTYRGDMIVDDYYRKTFTSNQLPNIYTAFMYFKKTRLSAEVFMMSEIIFKNWERFFYEFLDETRPRFLSGDVAYALAIKILGYESECTMPTSSIPGFVHMKSRLQNIPDQYLTDDWTKHIPTVFTSNGTLKIGNYQQYLPFHYHVKEWLTDDIVSKLEGTYNSCQ